MRRESTNFRVRSHIERIGAQRFVVVVSTEPDDPDARGATSVETFTAHTHEEAVRKQYEMVRAISALLKARGHHVVEVQTDL
jgi:hypothetical protein